MTDSLPKDVADVLDLVLNPDDPVHVALRRQVPQLRVVSRCECGCGTAYFGLDADAVEPAPTGLGTVVLPTCSCSPKPASAVGVPAHVHHLVRAKVHRFWRGDEAGRLAEPAVTSASGPAEPASPGCDGQPGRPRWTQEPAG
ncbi:hypothetical protein [Streptomyces sp. NPDC021224]|uniref:hypothetical protein n=1 Tax=unclassified Streptomyces TaxID=2593676 RepID=UPI00379C8A95